MTTSSMSELKNLYTELGVISNFSFLEGGSHPEELVETAISLGLELYLNSLETHGMTKG